MSSSPPPMASQESVDRLTELVMSLHDKLDKYIRSKSQRAVLVGSTEKSTPQETAAHDESTLKNIINVTNDSELKEAYDKGQITHHRFPENKPPGKRIIKRDLMPSELEQERNARDEARKRNIEANCLKWGVRDC
ncbi:hypothetical protein PMAYCL1PPCAC_03518, partial [Pristionchus mayeri]